MSVRCPAPPPRALARARREPIPGGGLQAAAGRRMAVGPVEGALVQQSAIEWTEATWNPVTGCHQVSPGCAHCYAKTFAELWRGVAGHHYEQGFDLRLWPERLEQPLRWRRPRMIFVNSMSDLFHEGIPDEYVAAVFDVMVRAEHHVF